MKKNVLILIFGFIVICFSFSDTVTMKNGDAFTGTIKSMDENIIVIKTEYGEIKVNKKDVKTISYEDKKMESKEQIEKSEEEKTKEEEMKEQVERIKKLTYTALGLFIPGAIFWIGGIPLVATSFIAFIPLFSAGITLFCIGIPLTIAGIVVYGVGVFRYKKFLKSLNKVSFGFGYDPYNERFALNVGLKF